MKLAYNFLHRLRIQHWMNICVCSGTTVLCEFKFLVFYRIKSLILICRDESTGMWSEDGLSTGYSSADSGYVTVHCNSMHLTAFHVLAAPNIQHIPNVSEFIYRNND